MLATPDDDKRYGPLPVLPLPLQIGSPVCQKDVTATCKKKYYASQRGFGSHINKEKHFLVPVEYPSYFPLDIDSMDDRLEGKELKPGVTLLCVPI